MRRATKITPLSVVLFFVLLVFWFLLTGVIDLGRVLVGIALAGGLTMLWQGTMQSKIPARGLSVRGRLRLAHFFVRLPWEILVANLKMMTLIWRPRSVVHPEFVKIEPRIESRVLRVLLANAITMTPGTLAILIDEKSLLIHCVDESLALGIKDSPLIRLLERVEEVES